MNRSMKKNLFFGLMALAGLFTSCSQDDTDASPTADSNQVSMSIGMPADFVKTRASAPRYVSRRPYAALHPRSVDERWLYTKSTPGAVGNGWCR